MARFGKLGSDVELPSRQRSCPQMEKFKKVMEQSRREAARLEAIIEKRRVDMEGRRAQIEYNKKMKQEELKMKDEEMNKKMIIKKKMTKKVNKAPPVISSPVIDLELETNVTQPLLSVSEVSQLDSEAVVVPHSDSSFTINDSEGLVVISQSSPPLTVNQGVENLIEVVAAPKNALEVKGFNPLTQDPQVIIEGADDDVNQIIRGGEEERLGAPKLGAAYLSEPQLEAEAVVGAPKSGAAYHSEPQLEAEAVVGAPKSGAAYHSDPQLEAEAVVGAPKSGAAYHSEPQLDAEAVVGAPKSGAAYHSEPQLEAEAVVGAPKSGAAYHSEPQLEAEAIVGAPKSGAAYHSGPQLGAEEVVGAPKSGAVPRGPLGMRRKKNDARIGPLAILMRKQAEVRRARTQSKPFEIEMRKIARDALKLKQERKKLEREREEEKLKEEEMARAIQEMSKGLNEIKMGLAFI